MKKNYGFFIGFIIVVLAIISFSVFYVLNNVNGESYTFNKDGYALSAKSTLDISASVGYFEYDLSKIYIYLNDNIIIEYDFILKDFIIEIKEEEISYYNLEKIPTKYTYIKERVNDFSLTLF